MEHIILCTPAPISWSKGISMSTTASPSLAVTPPVPSYATQNSRALLTSGPHFLFPHLFSPRCFFFTHPALPQGPCTYHSFLHFSLFLLLETQETLRGLPRGTQSEALSLLLPLPVSKVRPPLWVSVITPWYSVHSSLLVCKSHEDKDVTGGTMLSTGHTERLGTQRSWHMQGPGSCPCMAGAAGPRQASGSQVLIQRLLLPETHSQ